MARKGKRLDKRKKQQIDQENKIHVRDEKLDSHAATALVTYGKSVIEERALPDYRDGLKPVNRRILWTMHVNGIKSDKKFVKSANVSGLTMAHHHPHGDAAIYDAMVKMTNTQNNIDNTSLALVLGQGNFGWWNSPPAASRYTECKLAKYSDRVLLDPEYLKVIDKVANYDGTREEPLILPSKLPTLLFTGTRGIAVGTTTYIPPFKPKGVIELVRKALKGRDITPKMCVRNLEFNYPFGAICHSSDAELRQYYKTGVGTVYFGCDYEIDEKDKSITITGLSPNFNMEKLQERLLNKTDIVQSVDDNSDKSGIKIVIKLKDSVPQREVHERFKEIDNPLYSSVSFHTNITIRKMAENVETAEASAEFKRTTIPELIQDWAKWRIELETAYLQNRRKELRDHIEYQELLKYAIDHLDKIFQVLKSSTKNSDDLNKKLSKKLDITEDQARTILNRQVRSLSNLSKKDIEDRLDKLGKDLKQVKSDLKAPEDKVVRELDDIAQDIV